MGAGYPLTANQWGYTNYPSAYLGYNNGVGVAGYQTSLAGYPSSVIDPLLAPGSVAPGSDTTSPAGETWDMGGMWVRHR